MKPSRFIWYALLVVAFLCWWQLVISIQQSNVRVNGTPAVSHMPAIEHDTHAISNRPLIESGILSNPNFQNVLHALQQRADATELAEPHVTTAVYSGAGAINRSYYNQTFTLPIQQ